MATFIPHSILKFKKLIKRFVLSYGSILPLKKKQILFFSYYGENYGCSPKYISERLKKNDTKDFNIIWAFTHPEKYKFVDCKKVKFGSFKFLIAFSRSKIICTNFNLTSDLKKRKGQIYIQTWHNSLRIKKSHADVLNGLSSEFIKMAKRDGSQIDYMCCGSSFMHSVIKNSFWYKGEIIDSGLPRNDLLVKAPANLRKKIREQLDISDSTKILLYAPTFRKSRERFLYTLDIDKCINLLRNITGYEWIPILRLHPHLRSSYCRNILDYEKYLDVTDYDDISEILLIADILVTDYSSVMFDFSLQKKPVFIFAQDFDDYNENDFGFYFDFNELPFPIASENKLLLEAIREFNYKEYINRLELFNKKIGNFEDGNASERLTELIHLNLK